MKKSIAIIFLSALLCGFFGFGVANAESLPVTKAPNGELSLIITKNGIPTTYTYSIHSLGDGVWLNQTNKLTFFTNEEIEAAYLGTITPQVKKDEAAWAIAANNGLVPAKAADVRNNPVDNKSNDKLITQYTSLTDQGSLEQVLGPGNGGNLIQDLPSFLGSIFNFGIAAAVVLTLIMLMWGGIQYMTEESWTGKSDAKTRMQNAAFGLGLALASYIILYTINPCFVDFAGKKPGGCANPNILIYPTKIQAVANEPTGTVGGTMTAQQAAYYDGKNKCTAPASPSGGIGCVVHDCKTACVDAEAEFGIACADGANCTLNEPFAKKLNDFDDTIVPDVTITEGWPPTKFHTDGCHTNGTCADIRDYAAGNPTDVKKIYDALTGSPFNFRVLYEVKDCSSYTGKGGLPIYNGHGSGCYVDSNSTGPHFHVAL